MTKKTAQTPAKKRGRLTTGDIIERINGDVEKVERAALGKGLSQEDRDAVGALKKRVAKLLQLDELYSSGWSDAG